MNFTKLYVMSIVILLFASNLNAQQVLVNKKWEQSFGSPSEIDWSASVIDGAGNLITTGNTVISSTKIALLLTKQNASGTILWQKTFAITNASKNYGVALTTDNSNNIYVVGSCYENETTKHNMLMMKYNSSGTKLWHKTYNGPGNHDDAAVAVICNSTGSEVYVTGPSYGINSLADYLTLKLNTSTGNTTWERRFSHSSNLHDIPIALSFDGTGKVVIAGGSATDVLNYDILTLKYNVDGSLNDSLRVANPGLGYDQPSAMAKDAAGNLYITGSTTSDGVNFDIQTIKLSSSLDLVWKKTFDFSGFEDRATSVCVDAGGNVYVCGYGSVEESKKVLVALRYDAQGNLQWAEKYGEGEQEALAKKGMLDAQGNLIMTGSVKRGTNSSWITLQLDEAGKVEWSKEIDGDVGGDTEEAPTDIRLSANGDILVSGIKGEGENITYTTVRYEKWDRTTAFQNDSQGRPHVALNEIIVRFDSSAVIKQNIDRTEVIYEQPAFFLKAEVVAQLQARTGVEPSRLKLVRIFRHLTTKDTETTSRMGETIVVPDFWTAFIVVYPENINLSQQIGAFEAMFPNVRYAHPNWSGYKVGTAHDALYGEQASLHPTAMFPNAHVNVEPAWDKTGGKDFVKVAVFDGGVDYTHEDLNYMGVSKLIDGWELSLMTPITMIAVPDADGHGTACAGIIGALRNNTNAADDTLGVAGIAGGDYEKSDMPGFDSGVSLYNLDIFRGLDDTNGIDFPACIDAIVEGSMAFDATYPYRYGLHIMSNSWGVELDNSIIPENSDTIQLLSEAVHFANRAKVVYVASRGNDGNDDPKYPAVFDENWVMNIGASNEDGDYATWASFGRNVDVAAPGESDVVRALKQGGGYTTFNGTSSAAPHVAGGAALLLSQFNAPFSSLDNLAPEDVEHVIEKTAKDIDQGLPNIGYDDYTGWGKLNIGLAMDTVYRCPIKHFFSDYDPNGPVLVTAQTGNNQAVYLTEPVHTIEGNNFMEGNYTADVYQVTATVDHLLSAGEQIIDAWALHSCSHLMSTDFSGAYLIPHEFITLNNYSNTKATLSGYAFELFQGGVSLGWIPFNPNVNIPRFAYSLQVCGTSSTDDIISQQGNIKLYPNPTGDNLNIELVENTEMDIKTMDIYDMQGRLILQNSPVAGTRQYINTAGLNTGLYILRLQTDKGIIAAKFVKI